MKINALLADPAFEARMRAYDASEAFQLDTNPRTAADLLRAYAEAPDLAPKLDHAARKARHIIERAEAIGA